MTTLSFTHTCSDFKVPSVVLAFSLWFNNQHDNSNKVKCETHSPGSGVDFVAISLISTYISWTKHLTNMVLLTFLFLMISGTTLHYYSDIFMPIDATILKNALYGVSDRVLEQTPWFFLYVLDVRKNQIKGDSIKERWPRTPPQSQDYQSTLCYWVAKFAS